MDWLNEFREARSQREKDEEARDAELRRAAYEAYRPFRAKAKELGAFVPALLNDLGVELLGVRRKGLIFATAQKQFRIEENSGDERAYWNLCNLDWNDPRRYFGINFPYPKEPKREFAAFVSGSAYPYRESKRLDMLLEVAPAENEIMAALVKIATFVAEHDRCEVYWERVRRRGKR